VTRTASSPSKERLREALDGLYETFNSLDAPVDPVQIVRRYPDRTDREVVGFCAAALAFGRVSGILNSVERLLAVMGPSPASFVRSFEPRRDGALLARLVHRWTGAADLSALLTILRRMLERGSLESFFLDGDDPTAADVGPGLESFSTRALAEAPKAAGAGAARRPGVAYFFPRPSTGSACKRLNLFLRWMVRSDAVDLGVWSRVSRARLIIPLDTHVARVGRCLRLTRYASPGWRMAADITESLRELDPDDPVKYDFALCHLGIANECGFNRPEGDSLCPLRGLCHPGARRGAGRAGRRTPGQSPRPSGRR
jgi:uncharacterized protein (TIGR02757 family)